VRKPQILFLILAVNFFPSDLCAKERRKNGNLTAGVFLVAVGSGVSDVGSAL